MSQADWADLASPGLGSGDVNRGVSAAFTPPPGGASYVYGFRAATAITGVGGKVCDKTNFNPIAGTKKGGVMIACFKRYSAGVGYAPMFGLLSGNSPADSGYLIGLTDATTYKIAFKKGSPANGVDSDDATILRSSTETFTDVGDAEDVWFHIKMDILVNPHGEVIISIKRNLLQTIKDANGGPCNDPVWKAIPGMDDYIDDSLGILSESAPILEGFYPFFGMYTEQQAGRACFFDYISAYRQLTP